MSGQYFRPAMPDGGASCNRKPASRANEQDSLEKIERSIAYMRENIHHSLQVARLAALVNVSSSHYFALFKRHTGSAPIDYFIRLRMDHARHLLDTTALSVKGVAGALGYDDPFYFSRLFKAVTRTSPSEYRLLSAAQKELITRAILPGPAARLRTGPAKNDRMAGEDCPCKTEYRPLPSAERLPCCNEL